MSSKTLAVFCPNPSDAEKTFPSMRAYRAEQLGVLEYLPEWGSLRQNFRLNTLSQAVYSALSGMGMLLALPSRAYRMLSSYTFFAEFIRNPLNAFVLASAPLSMVLAVNPDSPWDQNKVTQYALLATWVCIFIALLPQLWKSHVDRLRQFVPNIANWITLRSESEAFSMRQDLWSYINKSDKVFNSLNIFFETLLLPLSIIFSVAHEFHDDVVGLILRGKRGESSDFVFYRDMSLIFMLSLIPTLLNMLSLVTKRLEAMPNKKIHHQLILHGLRILHLPGYFFYSAATIHSFVSLWVGFGAYIARGGNVLPLYTRIYIQAGIFAALTLPLGLVTTLAYGLMSYKFSERLLISAFKPLQRYNLRQYALESLDLGLDVMAKFEAFGWVLFYTVWSQLQPGADTLLPEVSLAFAIGSAVVGSLLILGTFGIGRYISSVLKAKQHENLAQQKAYLITIESQGNKDFVTPDIARVMYEKSQSGTSTLSVRIDGEAFQISESAGRLFDDIISSENVESLNITMLGLDASDSLTDSDRIVLAIAYQQRLLLLQNEIQDSAKYDAQLSRHKVQPLHHSVRINGVLYEDIPYRVIQTAMDVFSGCYTDWDVKEFHRFIQRYPNPIHQRLLENALYVSQETKTENARESIEINGVTYYVSERAAKLINAIQSSADNLTLENSTLNASDGNGGEFAYNVMDGRYSDRETCLIALAKVARYQELNPVQMRYGAFLPAPSSRRDIQDEKPIVGPTSVGGRSRRLSLSLNDKL